LVTGIRASVKDDSCKSERQSAQAWIWPLLLALLVA